MNLRQSWYAAALLLVTSCANPRDRLPAAPDLDISHGLKVTAQTPEADLVCVKKGPSLVTMAAAQDSLTHVHSRPPGRIFLQETAMGFVGGIQLDTTGESEVGNEKGPLSSDDAKEVLAEVKSFAGLCRDLTDGGRPSGAANIKAAGVSVPLSKEIAHNTAIIDLHALGLARPDLHPDLKVPKQNHEPQWHVPQPKQHKKPIIRASLD